LGPSTRLRVLVAGGNDNALVSLCDRIASWPAIEIVGWARSAGESGVLTSELVPDIVLMDVEAPGFGGSEAIRSVKVKPGKPFLLVLTSQDTPGIRMECFAAGADGFLTKSDPEEKLRALVSVIRPSS
jgi:DNA-binding NarL/FixJ family response regulator